MTGASLSWFTIIGLAFDIGGAIVLAMGFLTLKLSDLRAEGIPRWGANLWALSARERERTRVRIGVVVLVSGFALQLVASVTDLDESRELPAAWPLAAAAGVALLAVSIGWRAGRPVVRFDDAFDLGSRVVPTVIRDQRHAYATRTTEGVRAWWRTWARLVERSDLKRLQARSVAEIEHGTWRAPCPIDPTHEKAPAWPGHGRALCNECVGEFDVSFPSDADRFAIEEALLRRAREQDRRWSGESAQHLRDANAAGQVQLLP